MRCTIEFHHFRSCVDGPRGHTVLASKSDSDPAIPAVRDRQSSPNREGLPSSPECTTQSGQAPRRELLTWIRAKHGKVENFLRAAGARCIVEDKPLTERITDGGKE